DLVLARHRFNPQSHVLAGSPAVGWAESSRPTAGFPCSRCGLVWDGGPHKTRPTLPETCPCEPGASVQLDDDAEAEIRTGLQVALNLPLTAINFSEQPGYFSIVTLAAQNDLVVVSRVLQWDKPGWEASQIARPLAAVAGHVAAVIRAYVADRLAH